MYLICDLTEESSCLDIQHGILDMCKIYLNMRLNIVKGTTVFQSVFRF